MNNISASRVLIIVNNIPPYANELANVLAAPRLTTFRFRFQIKYTPTINSVEALISRLGTLILRNRTTAKMMPLCTFQVLEAKQVGDVNYITIELHDIIALSSEPQLCVGHKSEFHQLISSALSSYQNNPNDDLLNLVLFEDGKIHQKMALCLDSFGKNELVNWANCIRMMADDFNLTGIDYFRVVGLYDAERNSINYISKTIEERGFVIKPERKYTLEIIQRTYTGKKGDSSVDSLRSLELESLDPMIEILPRKRPILGKYDLLRYNIQTTRAAQQRLAQVFLSIKDQDSIRSNLALEIQFLIKQPAMYAIVRIFSFVIFMVSLVSYIFSDVVSNWFAEFSTIQASHIEKTAIIGMIISANVFGLFTKEIAARLKL